MTEAFSKELLRWYRQHRRDLPWRHTRDPYRIWVSEIMLQQTRVEAAVPYYHRFLERFPTLAALAEASENDVLTCWSGLGYYSRARNLQRAARAIHEFPLTYDAIRALPGIGDYTAAAVASIAFGLPHAVLDGNVMRVIARLTCDPSDIGAPATRKRMQATAQEWLDRRHPGEFNQAMMELGATVCLPRHPQCPLCPVRGHCAAVQAGRAGKLPVKLRKQTPVQIAGQLLVIEKAGAVLLWQREPESGRMADFWELPTPELVPFSGAQRVGSFRHTITHHHYTFEVLRASVRRTPKGFKWINPVQLTKVPLSTTARKALRIAGIVLEL